MSSRAESRDLVWWGRASFTTRPDPSTTLGMTVRKICSRSLSEAKDLACATFGDDEFLRFAQDDGRRSSPPIALSITRRITASRPAQGKSGRAMRSAVIPCTADQRA